MNIRTIAFLACISIVPTAKATAGVPLIAVPWIQSETEGSIEAWSWGTSTESSTLGASEDVSVSGVSLDARHQVIGQQFTLGVSHESIWFGNDIGLPDMAQDTLISAGFALAEFEIGEEAWYLFGEAGIGHASTDYFEDGEGWYGSGSLMAVGRVGERSQLRVGINYDGNRSILPDIPVPFVGLTTQVNPAFRYTVGLPVSNIWWQMSPDWNLNATFTVATPGNIRLTRKVSNQLSLFVQYDNTLLVFHDDDDQDNRRLFYRMSNVQIGMQARKDSMRFVAAIGWGFNGEIERGFDVLRENETAREFDDGIYLRAQASWKF